MFKKTRTFWHLVLQTLQAIHDRQVETVMTTAELTVAVKGLWERLAVIEGNLSYLVADRRHHNDKAAITIQ